MVFVLNCLFLTWFYLGYINMRIALASDLHLDIGGIELYNDNYADVLILSGDILVAESLHDNPRNTNDEDHFLYVGRSKLDAQRYRRFLQQVSEEFPHVIYVAGNHEFYHGKWSKSIDDLRNECDNYPNIYFLENNTKEIDGYTFVGCTLWTNMNKSDPLTLHAIRDMMTDYHVIVDDTRGYTRLRPATTVERHWRSVQYIRHVIEGKHDEKFVICTHHGPTPKSIDPYYIRDSLTNHAYVSDLSELILDHPQIKLWTAGHTHHKYQYHVGDTLVACNPRGYIGFEDMANEFELLYLDI